MIFLGNLTKITDTKCKIGFIHYMPFDSVNGLNKTAEQLEQEGVLVDSIPELQQVEGKSSVMYWNPVDNVIFYEYENIPKTQEDLLRDRITSLEIAMANLVGGAN